MQWRLKLDFLACFRLQMLTDNNFAQIINVLIVIISMRDVCFVSLAVKSCSLL